jgi:ATPase subunit of ABC transporter with duplicated ATPase domains
MPKPICSQRDRDQPANIKHGMISLTRICKQYGRQILFVDASFQLNPGETVGLVGPNGSGKTTLFRLITGEEVPDDGEISIPRKLTIGYFRQDVEESSGRSVLDEAILGSGRAGDLHHELERLHQAMSDPAQADGMDALLARFGEVQEEYEHLGGYALEAQAREVLHGLGFDDERIDGDVGALSGGWKMRVAMARVLLGRPDVLLMDEPTNHLDIESIVWLERFLKARSGALLMTSHDREFMNRVVSKIAEIDDGEITMYSGNYDFYEREREIREANREAAYARQQAMLAKEQRFIDRFAAHAAKAAQVQSRVKALEKIEKIELPKRRRVVHFDFRTPPRSGEQVVVLEDVAKAYGRRVVHDGLNLTIRRGERWCVMGKNGAGKSTLLKMVAGQLTPDRGHVRLGASVKMGYFAQVSLDLLDPDLTVEEQLRQDFPTESIGALRNLAGAFQFSGEDVDKKIRALSGGEKTRLVLARMLLVPPNLLVLDEPTNHLDLATKEMLLESLKGFDGTMLFVSHDRAFLRGLSNRVLELGGETGIEAEPHLYPGSYPEYVARTGHEALGVHA